MKFLDGISGNVLKTITLQGLTQLCLFAVILIGPNLYDIYEFGSIQQGLGLAQAIAMIALLGASTQLIREENKEIEFSRQLLRSAIIFSLGYLYVGYFAESFIVLVYYFVGYGIILAQVSFYKHVALGNAPKGNLIQFIRAFSFLIFFIAVSVLGSSHYILIIYTFLFILLILFFEKNKINLNLPNKNRALNYLDYQSIIAILINNMPFLFLTFYSNIKGIAILSIVLLISNLTSFGLYAINANISKDVSLKIKSRKLAELQSFCRRATIFAFVLFLFAVTIFSPFILLPSLIFGDEYASISYLLPMLLFGQMVNVISGSSALVANLMAMEKRVFILMSIGLFLQIGLLFTFYSSYGLYIVVLAQAICVAFWNLGVVFELKRIRNIKVAILP